MALIEYDPAGADPGVPARLLEAEICGLRDERDDLARKLADAVQILRNNADRIPGAIVFELMDALR
jgi:hypothetical protein